jgi:ubiquinone/menaquinone biosynthesis C-methylase UbiE
MARSFVPAAGHDLLLPLYDPLQRLLGGDAARRELVAAAAIRPSQRVLDIGCGTGSLIVEIGRRHPDVEIVGLDPDPKALARARRKLARAGVAARLDAGFADRLPYAAGAFDRVFSSFMFHHLDSDAKRGALCEVRRVLAPDGELHLLDFSSPGDGREGWLARLLHAGGHLHDNRADRLVAALRAAGFHDTRALWHRTGRVGRIAHYRSSLRPPPAG